MRWLLAAVLALPAAAEDALQVPSGQPVTLYEVVLEEGLQRWRFLARDVRAIELDAVLDDMQVLCDSHVLPSLDAAAKDDEIVINLMDRVVAFGESDPDARQHFEAYRIKNGVCIWEVF